MVRKGTEGGADLKFAITMSIVICKHTRTHIPINASELNKIE